MPAARSACPDMALGRLWPFPFGGNPDLALKQTTKGRGRGQAADPPIIPDGNPAGARAFATRLHLCPATFVVAAI
ncbi:hypothetical protein BJF92_21730 [Rhizobium rhizosphaerae]|uniref:Uncharacterized protein n=1 Tax=Xaviernesmea rhizosphaerae TaxID=1672749 RepID=A0A1Q9AQD0_9HYPH|nr:hypothetical protein BJF92_21730 [Xaviernesmea rhizosphaerae]OQP84170.1 hypothetical protein BTR14_20405 [Xaviernesmea rhizosphaerae]